MGLLTISILTLYYGCLCVSSVKTEEPWEGKTVKKYDGYQLLHLNPSSKDQYSYLQNLWLNDTSMHLDFWTDPAVPSKSVDVMVPPESLVMFKDQLNDLQMKYNVIMKDVQDAIELEKEAQKFSSSFLRDSIGGFGLSKEGASFYSPVYLNRYNSYPEIQKYLRQAEIQFPNLAKVHSLKDRSGNVAKTHDGRTLDMIQITGNINSSIRKPAFWIDGGIHAREWVAVSVPIYIINELLTKYETDPSIKGLVDDINWYILPVVNPDGYEYSRNYDRMWRKNRNPNNYQRFSWCWGVDLNRNFDWSFGGEGSSGDVCQETYRGTRAFSEPESEALSIQLKKLQSRLKAFITFHSYSQVWMYPFGHKRNVRSKDWRDLARVARKATAKLNGYYGRKYIIDTGANALYPAAGGSDDWVKGKVGAKYVYLVELRPSDHGREARAYGFLLPESQILPTCTETFAAVLEVAKEISARSVTFPLPSAQTSFIIKSTEQDKANSDNDNVDKVSGSQEKLTPISSGECKDLRSDCDYWKGRSNCNWFLSQCSKTCGVCS